MNINKSIPIVYDPEIINKIKEMIKEGFDKLKILIKSEPLKINIYNISSEINLSPVNFRRNIIYRW